MSASATPRQGLAGFVRQFATGGLAISAGIGSLFTYLSGDWIILPGMVMMWLFWRTLPSDDVPPGLQFSFSYHLFQIVAGVAYTALTDRSLTPHQAPQYHQMMVIAAGAIAAIFLGFMAGDRWLAKRRPIISRVPLDVSFSQLLTAYIFMVVFRDTIISFVNDVPAFAQAILAVSALQMGLFYLVLRKLFREQRYVFVLLVVGFETLRGFGGFYSSFKEPLILALIAGMEVFQPRKALHWALSVVLVVSALSLSVVWLGIRGAIREDITRGDVLRGQTQRLQFALDEFRLWWATETEYKMYDVDALAERVWDIYYTALALDKVPDLIPHENGTLISAAIQHVLTPRFLNPNKPALPSESEDVFRYTGLKVAGRDEGTTIAFGYAIQSYIDFGLPWMFVPPLAFGLFFGLAYRYVLTTVHHEEILIAVLAVAFWANIMPYNTSWAKMLGKLLTSLVYIGATAIVVDHMLFTNRTRRLGEMQFKQQAARVP